ncbi:MAG: GntR family transcriptional regulator [Chloroflexi bacterium]|nr:GntR family transcriptional regulator [Chloroflexota bacterium]
MSGDAAEPSSTLRESPVDDHALPSGERIYQRLRAAILRGQLPPGARLVEWNLAAEFGVSRTPVREALKRLSGEGLVAVDASRGLVVRGLSLREVEEIYEVLEMLEAPATRLAAQRRSPEELAKLRVVLELMAEYTERGQTDALVQANSKFHGVIAQAARNEWLLETMRGIHDFVPRFSLASFASLERSQEVLEEHVAIVRALERGDGDEAERLARQHLARARSFLARLALEQEAAF